MKVQIIETGERHEMTWERANLKPEYLVIDDRWCNDMQIVFEGDSITELFSDAFREFKDSLDDGYKTQAKELFEENFREDNISIDEYWPDTNIVYADGNYYSYYDNGSVVEKGTGFSVERIELFQDGQAVVHLKHGNEHYAAIRGTDGDFEVCAASSIQTDGEDRHDAFATNFGPHIDDLLEELGVPTAKDKYLDLVAHDDVVNPRAANIDEIVANLSLRQIDLNDGPGGYAATYTLENPDGDTCANIELRRMYLPGGETGDWGYYWAGWTEGGLDRRDIARALENNFFCATIAEALDLPENYLDLVADRDGISVNNYIIESLPLVKQLRDGYAVKGRLPLAEQLRDGYPVNERPKRGYYVDGAKAAVFYEAHLADKRYIEARSDNEAVELFARPRGAFAAHWAQEDGRMVLQSITAVPEEEALKLQTPEKGTIPEAWREAGIHCARLPRGCGL